jgi:hypothetical protein
MFVEELVSSGEKKETLARWSYEIYSTFLMNNAVRIQFERLPVLTHNFCGKHQTYAPNKSGLGFSFF